MISQSLVKLTALAKNSENSQLIPISAISFEPDGAEVFIINDENIVTRQKVTTGKIISNAIEILGGLEINQKIVQYRNRTNSGEEVIIK